MKKILVVPDSHARPEISNRRFDALANFIIDKRPDIIVNIGDMADMGSLSKYDVGTVHAEGKRYSDDIRAANDAIRRTTTPVNKYSEKLRTGRRKRYDPEWYITIGNHENRIMRAGAESPAMFEHLSLNDLQFEEHGWSVIPFLEPLVIEDICFKHYFTSGIMGRPIGGDNHAASLVKKGHMSCVAGHSHMRDYWETVDASGRRKFGLVVGCYDEGPHHYTTEGGRWWSGLVMLNDVQEGSCEPAFFSFNYVIDNFL